MRPYAAARDGGGARARGGAVRKAVWRARGSAPHAEVFFKTLAGLYERECGRGGADTLPPVFTLNLLVPRPEGAQLPATPGPSPPVSPATAIPTVAVRR